MCVSWFPPRCLVVWARCWSAIGLWLACVDGSDVEYLVFGCLRGSWTRNWELGIGTWLTGVFRMDIAKNNKYQVEEKKLRPFEGMF